MLKLHQIYFRKLIIPFILLFFIVGLIIYYSIKDIYIKQIKEELLYDTKFIFMEIKNLDNIDNLVKKIKQEINIRVTIIKDNGVVLAESDKDKSIMNNHKYRPEIIEARKNLHGYSIRHSHTLNKDLLYVAKKYKKNGNIFYIRVAKEIKPINSEIISMGLKVLGIVILFFAIMFFNIYTLGVSLEKEINKISKFLLKLTKKKRETYITSQFSTEFYNITKLLTKVASILSKIDNKKAKYTNKLKKVNKQKDEIISAISHEFKNPITVINGYSQTLLEDKDIDDEIRNKFLEKIFANGERLSNLIDTLRLSLKLENGKIQTSFENHNIYNIVEESIENLKPIYKDREIKLSGKTNTILKVDKILFSIAILNIIENGLKYSEDEIEIIVEDNYISIKDYGIGIAEKELKNITKKFYRVSGNKWNNSLGLGLSIVVNILNLHNFKLNIESQKNEGSKFIILF